MISVVCYLWRGVRHFSPQYATVLARMVRRHLPEPHRFICVTAIGTDGFGREVEVLPMPTEAMPLLAIPAPDGERFPSSYARLWSFAPQARAALGERILQLDIDCVICNPLAPLIAPQHDFVGWPLPSPNNGPRRFGGGTWLHTTGTRPHVWQEFMADPAGAIAAARARGFRGSDQAWISYCLADREHAWPIPSGIYRAKDHRVLSPELQRAARGRRRRRPAPRSSRGELIQAPADTIILHLNGKTKPWHTDDPFIRKHWQPHLTAPC